MTMFLAVFDSLLAGLVGGEGAVAATGAPHSKQNLASLGSFFPHLGQNGMIVALATA